jgi:heme/copper-type cytochrome/quinol oxidase subunit 2
MVATVRVVSSEGYEAWAARQKLLLADAEQSLKAQRREMLHDDQLPGSGQP